MKRIYTYYYILMIALNMLTFIPMSIKGILGIIFIVISCVYISFKDGLITATIWVVFGIFNFTLGINMDYKQGILAMFLGSALYYGTAYYFGRVTKALKDKNNMLKEEIDKRERTEKALKEKLTLLQSLMDTIPSPIFFKDLEFKYISCNRAFEVLSGLCEKDLIGKTIFDIPNIYSSQEYHEKDVKLVEDGEKQVFEVEVKFADGSLRNVIFNRAIFTDAMDNAMGIVGVMTDTTDKKEKEALKQSIADNKRIIDEILEIDKMKTEFLSNISHELRTPINVILSSIQLMNIYTKDNHYNNSQDKIIRKTCTMKQNCYRLLRLVNNLIDISKIDANALQLNLKNNNIVSVVEEITLCVSEYLGDKGIKLVFDTEIEEKMIACDDEKIERIMLNLLSNAIKHTPDNGSIFVNIYDKDDSLDIEVKDNGIGIPKNKQDKIFKRFCQTDDMFTRQHEGSGIGLNLVKSLVEMHGGKVTFESKVGEGTSFKVNLPIVKVTEEAKQEKYLIKQAPSERINIEFSDIYSLNNKLGA